MLGIGNILNSKEQSNNNKKKQTKQIKGPIK